VSTQQAHPEHVTTQQARHERVQTQETLEPTDLTRRRVRLLLPALLLVTLAYPASEQHPVAVLAYGFGFVILLALGTRVAGVTRWRRIVAVTIAAAIALLSVPWVMFPEMRWLSLSVYALLVGFHLLVIAAVGTHLLETHGLDRDVLLAGTSLYVLVGDMFVAAAMVVHQVSIDVAGTAAYAADWPITWQRMAYYSFATLTTLGPDGIRPVTSAAQALTIAEAIFGVLIIALIVARLAGAALVAGISRR
jgi:hypothetical protein